VITIEIVNQTGSDQSVKISLHRIGHGYGDLSAAWLASTRVGLAAGLRLVRARDASTAGARLWPRSVVKKGHERLGFRWVQSVPIGRHVAAALQYLANDLILRHAGGNRIEGWVLVVRRPQQANGNCGTACLAAPWRPAVQAACAACRYSTGTASCDQACITGLQGCRFRDA
jgi:hypothetical protein